MARWNVDGNFTLPDMDTGNIEKTCLSDAPWGPGSWGIEGATFRNTSDHKLDGQRFKTSGDRAYLWGREKSGAWGLVRYIQGDIWGGCICGGPVPWWTPAPLPITVGCGMLTMSLDLYRDESRPLLTSNKSWVMYAINVWVSSPQFPHPGGDRNRRRPLVLDLAFYHWTNTGGHLKNFIDQQHTAYHYQKLHGTTPLKQWKSWRIDLSFYINDALSRWNLPAKDAQVYQVEFLIELYNAEGAATFDNFFLDY